MTRSYNTQMQLYYSKKPGSFQSFVNNFKILPLNYYSVDMKSESCFPLHPGSWSHNHHLRSAQYLNPLKAVLSLLH